MSARIDLDPVEETDELCALFGFTPDELALNRSGRLSARQRQTVRFRAIGLLVRGLAFVILTVILLASQAAQLRTGWQRALAIAVAALAIAVWLAGVWVVLRPDVRRVAGPCRRNGTPRHPLVNVGGEKLAVSYRRWKRLPPALPGTYVAYYSTPDHALLSIEPGKGDPEWICRSSS